AREPPLARRGKQRGCALRKPPDPVVFRPELAVQDRGTLEVVAEQLFDLAETARELTLDEVGKTFVEVAAALLGDPVVRGLSDQQVPKTERRLARGPIRADELLSDQRSEARLHVVPFEQLLQAAPAEERSHDRGCLDRRLLVGGQAVESRREDGLDRRRNASRRDRTTRRLVLLQRALVDQHRQDLLQE